MQSRRETKMVVWLASIRLRSYGIIDCACPVLCDVWGVTKSYFIYITPKSRARCLMHIIITLDFLRLTCTLSSYKIREHSRRLSRFLALMLRRGIVFVLIFVHYQNINLRRQFIDNFRYSIVWGWLCWHAYYYVSVKSKLQHTPAGHVDTLTITCRFKQLWSLRYFPFRLI